MLSIHKDHCNSGRLDEVHDKMKVECNLSINTKVQKSMEIFAKIQEMIKPEMAIIGRCEEEVSNVIQVMTVEMQNMDDALRKTKDKDVANNIFLMEEKLNILNEKKKMMDREMQIMDLEIMVMSKKLNVKKQKNIGRDILCTIRSRKRTSWIFGHHQEHQKYCSKEN